MIDVSVYNSKKHNQQSDYNFIIWKMGAILNFRILLHKIACISVNGVK